MPATEYAESGARFQAKSAPQRAEKQIYVAYAT